VSVDQAAKLSTLLERLGRDYPDIQASPAVPSIDPDEPLLAEFVRSMMLWECTQPKAAAAMKRLESQIVDFNELRVCIPRELVRLIGETYPRAGERAERLKAALADLYSRAHAVTLKHLSDMGKREVKSYLETLNGVPSFVAARVALLFLGNHSMPMDSRSLRVLIEASVVPEGETIESAASLLERKIRAGELALAYLRLQARSDELKFVEAETRAAPPPESRRVQAPPPPLALEPKPKPSGKSPRSSGGKSPTKRSAE